MKNYKVTWIESYVDRSFSKNVHVQMGRCPVRSIFPDALAVLAKTQHLLG